MTKARDIADFKFENIVDTGTEGIKVATGTTAQRGTTVGQFRYNSDLGKFEGRNAEGFVPIEGFPTVSSIDVSNVTEAEISTGKDITITGTNFDTGVTVKFVGQDGTEYASPSVTRNSSTSLTARITSGVNNANEPYDVSVSNPNGLSAVLSNCFDVDGKPVWNTASGNLTSVTEQQSFSTSATATDPEGDTVSYSETGGTVLSDNSLTLNSSTGGITGTAPSVSADTTLTFSLRATSGTNISDRSFNIIILNVDGSSYDKAISIADNTSPITTILTSNGEADGGITEGVYFINVNGNDSTNRTFPVVLRNMNGNTWLCMKKNFTPHAQKANLTYGLMDGSNNALTGLNTRLGSSTTVDAVSLGDQQFQISGQYFNGTWATNFGVYANNNTFYSTAYSGILAKIRTEEVYDNHYTDNGNYTSIGGGKYFIWRTRWTATDGDVNKYAITSDVSNTGDIHNNANDFTGVDYVQDSSTFNYTGFNGDNTLIGSNYGAFSMWIR